MILDPKRATATLREYIRKRHPGRFDLVNKLDDQIRDEFRSTDPVLLNRANGWLENGLHRIALQTLLDKDTYTKDTTSHGLQVSCIFMTLPRESLPRTNRFS